jgi:hypothetical protein
MKTTRLLNPLLSLFLLIITTMCTTGSSISSSSDPSQLINTAKQGTWRISGYNDSGTNETSHFTGYNFTFGNSNAITATNGTNTYYGTWSVNAVLDIDDNPTGELDFYISFDSPVDFADLTDNWDVVSYTSNRIYLTDVSGGSGGNDILEFTKN